MQESIFKNGAEGFNISVFCQLTNQNLKYIFFFLHMINRINKPTEYNSVLLVLWVYLDAL